LRCPYCNSSEIQKTRINAEGISVYQCITCGHWLFREQEEDLLKGEMISHQFNPTARDGKD